MLYRRRGGALEVLLVHPGGPMWARRDLGAWSIPKGEYEPEEEPLTAARREYEEELGTAPPDGPVEDLGEIRQKSGKRVRAWALEGDLDAEQVRSNTFEFEWPPRSGKTIEIPEVDRAEWFGLEVAREKINPAQVALLDRLQELQEDEPVGDDQPYGPLHGLRVGAQRSVAPGALDARGSRAVRVAAPGDDDQPRAGGASLEAYLLARHRAIDVLLERAIEANEVTQVIEVACGLSPRGWRFTQRYGERLTYVETDLPDMASRKRRALKRMGALNERHQVRDVDALQDQGPDSLAALAAELNPDEGLAIITEGLLGYLPGDAVAACGGASPARSPAFPRGTYISDLHLGGVQTAQVRLFRVLLSAFVRGRVYLHFDSAAEATTALKAAGFARAEVHPAASLAPEEQGPAERPCAYT